MTPKDPKELAEWNSVNKSLPTREEMEHGVVPAPGTHRDMGRHLLPYGAVSVPSGKTIPVSGRYGVYGSLQKKQYFEKGEEAPFIEERGHLWVLKDEA